MKSKKKSKCGAVCCSVVRCGAVCCSVVRCGAESYNQLATEFDTSHCDVATCCSTSVALRCNMLQYISVTSSGTCDYVCARTNIHTYTHAQTHSILLSLPYALTPCLDGGDRT